MSSRRQRAANRAARTGPISIRAVVSDIAGPKARQYVVAYPREFAGDNLTDETSITFPLTEWKGAEPPRSGQMVTLENVQLFERGWRASRARPITPSSQQ
jgi:hypothetical protein